MGPPFLCLQIMTAKEQTDALRAFCGWVKCKACEPGGCCFWWSPAEDPSECRATHFAPNYAEDLNATHDVELLLKDKNAGKIDGLWWDYRACLIDIQERDGEEFSDGINASAAQKTEALCRTADLWTD